MANSARVNSGNMPRLLQGSIDMVLKHFDKTLKGMGNEIFEKMKTDKGFYEAVQLAGMGLAAIKGEGSQVSVDSVDQDWVYRWPVVCYSKAARVTMEAIADNQYEDVIPMLGQNMAEGLAQNKDVRMATVLNDGFSTGQNPDGVALFSASHTIQAGGTTSNLLSPAADMSEDAIEQMILLVDNLVLPSGLKSDYSSKDLVVPIQLRFEADRIVNSRYRVSSADNDISAIYNQNVIKRVLPWKRLTDTDAFFITTNAPKGLMLIERAGVTTDSFKEPTTLDVIITAYERFVALYADFRGVVGSQGA